MPENVVEWRCACGQKLTAAPARAGLSWKCPKCGAKGIVPGRKSSGVPESNEEILGRFLSRPLNASRPVESPPEPEMWEPEVPTPQRLPPPPPEVRDPDPEPESVEKPLRPPPVIVLPIVRRYDNLHGVIRWLRFCANVIRALGILVAGLFVLVTIAGLFSYDIRQFFEGRVLAGVLNLVVLFLGTAVMAAVAIGVTFFIAMLVDALAEVILVLIDIEQNTRAAALNR